MATSADLRINKTGPPTVTAGTNVTYTVTLSNSGPSDAQSVALTDSLPAGTTFVSQSQSSGPAFALTNPGGNVSDSIGALAAGASASFVLVVHANSNDPAGSLITNTGNISSATSDPNSANNSSSRISTVAASADIAVTKTGPATVTAGTNVTYTVTLSNSGPSDAQSVALTDSLPAGANFVSQSQVSGPAFALSNSGNNITDTRGTLAAGASASFQIVIQSNLSLAHGSTLSNTAVVGSTASDPNNSNNSSTVSSTVQIDGTLSATLSGSVLTVSDVDPTGKNNDFGIKVVGSSLVISDPVEQFGNAPPGSTRSNGNRTLTIPLASVSTLTVNGNGGGDTFALGALGSLGALNLNGGEGNDTFGSASQKIVPSTITRIAIDGGGPAGPASPGDAAGDIVSIDFSSLAQTTFLVFGTPSASPLTTLIASGIKPFSYRQIEDLDLYDGGSQTVAQNGDVYVRGSIGTDTIQISGSGNEAVVRVNSFLGNYLVTGRTVVHARAGNDTVHQNNFPHTALVFGEDGNDALTGSTASDRLYGGKGNDTLQGNGGDDLLAGNDGADQLFGSFGNDVLIGGAGTDTLQGDDGHDLFFKGRVNVTAPSVGNDDGAASYLNDLAMLALFTDWTSDLSLNTTSYSTDDEQSND